MNPKPRLWPSVLCVIAAAVIWQLWGDRYIAAEVALFALCGAALLFGVNWLVHEYNARRAEWLKAGDLEHVHNLDKKDLFAIASKLNTEQIAALNNIGIRRILVPGLKGQPPKQFVEVGNRRINEEFIHAFLAAGVGDWLPPIRSWGDGSNERLDAEALTAYFIEYKFAAPAAGPRPAKWVDRAGGILSIGLEPQ